MALKESLQKGRDFIYSLSDASFGKLTSGIENETLRKRLQYIDYRYNEGRYLGLALFASFTVTLLMGLFSVFLLFSGIFADSIVILLPFLAFFLSLGFALAWPIIDFSSKMKSIDADMPLAILTMSTAVEAGAPPQFIFDAIANNPDYPRLGKEAAKVKRFMEQLGLSFSEEVDKTINITPAMAFKRFLKELNTTMKSGGDLKSFMAKKAEAAYFDYTVKLDVASKNAETMGDIYSMIMIAAPIFLFFTVMLMGIFTGGAGFLGFDLNTIMNASIFLLIPFINLGFLAFMEITSPG